MSGKGSKQRPTNHEAFSSNFDAIFNRDKHEDEAPMSDYVCDRCGPVDESEVHEEIEINHEPMGDQTVERREVYLTCEHCGGDVEYTM